MEGAEMCVMTMPSMKWCMNRADITEKFYDSGDEQNAA